MKVLNTRNITNVGKCLRTLPTFVFFIISLFTLKASELYVKPDFAFPKTVEEMSDSLLEISLQQGDQLMALRYAMNVCISSSLLNENESIAGDIALLDSVTNKLSGEYKRLAFLLEADILKQAYLQNSNVYDSRLLPLTEPFPEDPSEWSGEMYKEKILKLVETANEGYESLQGNFIGEISLLLSNYETAEAIGMNIPQFIAFKGEAILKSLSRSERQTVIPFYPSEIVNTIEAKCEEMAKNLLLGLINNDKWNNSLVTGMAAVENIPFIPDVKLEEYLNTCRLKLMNTEGEGMILYELWSRYGNSDPKFYYTEILNYLSQFPKGFNYQRLQNVLSEITRKEVTAEFPKTSSPFISIKGKAHVTNIDKAFLLVYKLKNSESTVYDELISKKFNYNRKPDHIIEVSNIGNIPFSYEKEVEIPGLTEGLYVVIPSVTKTLTKGWNNSDSGNYTTFRITDIALISSFDSNEKESGKVYVVKGKDQQPVAGATVTYYQGNSKSAKGRLVTNKDGYVDIPIGYYRVEGTFGSSMAKRDLGFSYYPDNVKSVRHATILTDLSIYRPGDTIRFAVVGWLQDKINNSIVSDCKIDVVLRDVNYSQVANTTLTLDKNGRANGELIIPRGRLLGNYTIEANFPDFKGSGSGYTTVAVEEYKLPAFQVVLEQEESEDKDQLCFKGSALTYAGMPVTDGVVDFKVEFVPWRWGYMGNNASYRQAAKTDSEGNFILELPVAELKGTIFERGRYSLTASVTSEAGETEKSKPLYFSLGTGADIRPSIPDKIKVTGDSIKFNVSVYDIGGLPVRTVLNYRIVNLTDTAYSLKGSFISPELSIPSDKLIPGRYRFEFSDNNQNKPISTETVLWREHDSKVPYPTPLWLPRQEYVYEQDRSSLEIAFGSYWNDWILSILSDGEKILETKWVAPSDTIIKMRLEIPEYKPTLFLTLCGMHEFKSETGLITIVPKQSLEKMEVIATSFRDNITANEEETWNFKFKIDDKNPGKINAFAVMTDKALNAFRDFKWGLNIWKPGIYNKVKLNPQRLGESFSYNNFGSVIPFQTVTRNGFMIPDWETYGYSFIPASGFMFEGVKLYKAAAMTTRNSMKDAAAGAIITEAADEAVIEEAAQQPIEDNDEDVLRPVEMPVAFFMPDLQSNENGELTLKFKVPDFNTTWQFQLAGYNQDLLNTTLLLDVLAAKEVMVKTNLPQFLRTGDVTEISATIYNNSDSVLPIKGKIEVFNPINGVILGVREFSEINVSPSGNRVVSIGFDVPDNLSVIAVRSFGFGKNHSDGEQGYIPVLPSSTPVTESITFYAKTDEGNIEIKVPKLIKDANVTLKYCDNPLWEVLLALPGFIDGTRGGALSVSRWLYGTLTSLEIISSNQQIAQGLRKILESEDSTLSMSNLQKDQNLKITELEATPWLNNATNETLRIRSLEKYLDRNTVLPQIDLKIEALRKLQNPDGGFSWFEGMKSSPYITSEVINVLGYLKNNSILPDNLASLAQNGVKFYDRWLEENIHKNKGFNVISVMHYFYSRNMFGYPMSSSLKKIEKECLDSIVSQWRFWNCGEKAMGAMVLLNSDKYREEVNIIGSSLRQFIGTKIPIAEEALMLNLFEKIEPSGDSAERICESMFLQKETEDWGTDLSTSSIIHAMVNVSSRENKNRDIPDIYVGDEPVDLSETQALTGNFTINLDAKKVNGKKITIRRKTGIPAWGGVIRQFVKPIKDVKAENEENLYVEKMVLKKNNKGKMKETRSFEKGDKVTVVLHIYCQKDMDYVVVTDSRSACLQPDSKISGITYLDGIQVYKEIRKDKTSFFIENLPAGKHIISYECHVDRSGEYTLGIAETQCLYSPAQVSHSAGSRIKVEQRINRD